MKHKPGDKQLEILLSRSAGQTRLTPLKPDNKALPLADKNNGSGLWRTVLEVVSGVIAAVPIGIWLYFMSIFIWAEVVTVLAIPVALIPYVGPRVMDWLNFSRGVVPLIVAVAMAMELWGCRVLIRRQYRVFAYTQAFLGMAVSSPFFYWTVVHQKPLLPFWGQ